MDTEIKTEIEKLAQSINEGFEETRKEIGELRTEMREQIDGVKLHVEAVQALQRSNAHEIERLPHRIEVVMDETYGKAIDNIEARLQKAGI